MSLLPAHIEAMRKWLASIDEVVVVDSESQDGTVEYLRHNLRHPRLRILSHPPGLYQSWNFGIAQCRAKYIYISTVGETMAADGLPELFATAERFTADVVISPPRMVNERGRAQKKRWPIHKLLAQLRLSEPIALPPDLAQLFVITFVQRGILGSSASNLYRAEVLHRFPFRTDFGRAGDLAWGLEHAGEITLAIVPRSFSTFLFHPKLYARNEYSVGSISSKCVPVARAVLEKNKRRGGDTQIELLLNELLQAWEKYLERKRCVTEAKRPTFWWLAPGAWRAHRARHVAFNELSVLQRKAMLELAARVKHDPCPR